MRRSRSFTEHTTSALTSDCLSTPLGRAWLTYAQNSSPFIVNGAGVLVMLAGITVVVVAGPRYLSRKGMVVRSHEPGCVIALEDPRAPDSRGS